MLLQVELQKHLKVKINNVKRALISALSFCLNMGLSDKDILSNFIKNQSQMNLTGVELTQQGIIFGSIVSDNIQQHGIDLNLIKVEKLDGKQGHGIIPQNGKTTLCHRREIFPTKPESYDEQGWYLESGTYDVTFAQGCKVPSNQRLFIRQRSSLLRNGTILHSSVFDAGFETQNIGTIIVVTQPIFIECKARIAQIYASCSNEVKNLYNGQWQGDKQRDNQSQASSQS